VHLVISDTDQQERNRAMLKAMFEREKKKRNKDKKVKEHDEGKGET
jgi:hypothetical protein